MFESLYGQDIVRDFSIRSQDPSKLAAKQRGVVEAMLDARPPTGFRTAEYTQPNTFEGFVARSLHWHVRNALSRGDAEEPPRDWIMHPDRAVQDAVAIALGRESLVSFGTAWEAGGDATLAASYFWAASLLGERGVCSAAESNDLVYKAAAALESHQAAPTGYARTIELVVLNNACQCASSSRTRAHAAPSPPSF